MNELHIPHSAVGDTKARELLRVWAANQKQHVTIDATAWKDPGSWGIMLADLARHISYALQQTTGKNPEESLQVIRSALEAELDNPTDEVTVKG